MSRSITPDEEKTPDIGDVLSKLLGSSGASEKQKNIPASPTPALASPPEAPDVSNVESGWAALATAVREIDEPLVKDFKEDIDTILVFAGLYSAVLTGLLAQSITNLQQDPSSVTNNLLGQMLTQTHSYIIGGLYFNSSAPLPSLNPPPFSPSLAAKRVNILWFASLMLSLISASFGILVKQWLREYLAGIYSSPEARVRVRHFREPGLRHWRVFSVAAILPLLLQVALALFFIGLCFFTLDIHTSVGYTTIPLATAWAVLFVAISFAPIFSPRCPYKTPMLKYLTGFLRRALYRLILSFVRLVHHDPSTMPQKSQWQVPAKWTWWLLSYDEEHAASSLKNDVNALLVLDAMQRDDRLLQKMCSVLHERHTPHDEIVEFVLRVISTRLPLAELSRPLPRMLDLTMLQPRTCVILTDTIAQALTTEVKKVLLSKALDWSEAMKDSIAILCAKLPCLLSDKANKALWLCASGNFSCRMGPFMRILMNGVEPERRFVLGLHLQERLRPMLLQLDGDDFDSFLSGLGRMYCNCDKHGAYGQKFIGHREEMTLVVENNLMDLVVEYLHQHTKVPNARWMPYHSNIMTFVNNSWGASNDGLWYTGYIECVTSLLLHPTIGPDVASILYHYTYFSQTGIEVCGRAFQRSSDYREGILSTVARSLEVYIDNCRSQIHARRIHPYFTPHLCRFVYLQLSLQRWSLEGNIGYQSLFKWFQPLWQSMFTSIASILNLCFDKGQGPFRPACGSAGQEALWVALSCLDNMHEVELLWKDYSKGEEADLQMDFFVGDDIFNAICRLVPPERANHAREAREKLTSNRSSSTPTLIQEGLWAEAPASNAINMFRLTMDRHLDRNSQVQRLMDTFKSLTSDNSEPEESGLSGLDPEAEAEFKALKPMISGTLRSMLSDEPEPDAMDPDKLAQVLKSVLAKYRERRVGAGGDGEGESDIASDVLADSAREAEAGPSAL